jgi:hypothetical protein
VTKHALILMLSSIFGGIGWWIGDFINVAAALIISTVASFYGLYLGWKLNSEYLE